MGVLGVQVVLTMIVASFLHKLSPYYSLGRWLAAASMRRFVPPRDSILKPYVSVAAGNARNKRKSPASTAHARGGLLENHKPLDTSLTLPKSSPISLSSTAIVPSDLHLIHYYAEFRWLVDLGLATITVYICTCFYYTLRPRVIAVEYNLSVVWLIFLFTFATILLGSITKVYFSHELSRERSIIVVFTTLFFILALGILLIDEDILQFRLVETHTNISQCVGKLLHTYIADPDNFKLLPLWAFKGGLAVCASCLSALLVYPSFRYSEMHFNAVLTSKNVWSKLVVRLCYLMPLFCLGLWVKPFSKDIFSELDLIPILGLDIYYETFRFWSLILCCGLRFALFKLHLQNYLDLARYRVDELTQEQGRITIKDLRKRVSNIFAFYAGIALQYIAPVFMTLSLAILMHLSSPYYAQSGAAMDDSATMEEEEESGRLGPQNLFKSSGFGVALFHGCISFLCWWVCFTVFIASGFGSALRSYL